ATYHTAYPAAVRCLLDDRQALTVYLRFPREHWHRIRHSNFIERTFGETRRRVKVIGRLPGETSCVSLVWAVLGRASPGLRVSTVPSMGTRLLQNVRRQLGLRYRPGDEPPADGSADDADWLVLVDDAGVRKLAFQQVDHLPRTTWPRHDIPMQLHVDFTVSSPAELQRQRQRAEALGAELLLDRA